MKELRKPAQPNGEAFSLVQINYDYRYTSNAHQHELTQRILALLGADVPNA